VFRTGLYSGNIFLPRNEKSGPGQTLKKTTCIENMYKLNLIHDGGALQKVK